jgi:hypothetical protein
MEEVTANKRFSFVTRVSDWQRVIVNQFQVVSI